MRGRHVRAVFVAGRRRGSEEAEEASPQVDELMMPSSLLPLWVIYMGIGGVTGKGIWK